MNQELFRSPEPLKGSDGIVSEANAGVGDRTAAENQESSSSSSGANSDSDISNGEGSSKRKDCSCRDEADGGSTSMLIPNLSHRRYQCVVIDFCIHCCNRIHML